MWISRRTVDFNIRNEINVFLLIVNEVIVSNRLGKNRWTSKIVKNITRSLSELFKNSELDNQDVHQSILKLARTCSAVEKFEKSTDEDEDIWLQIIELIVSTLCFGDQQHFYNLGELCFPSIRYINSLKLNRIAIFICCSVSWLATDMLNVFNWEVPVGKL